MRPPNLHRPDARLFFMALDLYVHANIDFLEVYKPSNGVARDGLSTSHASRGCGIS